MSKVDVKSSYQTRRTESSILPDKGKQKPETTQTTRDVGQTFSDKHYKESDEVKENARWKQAVENEVRCFKNWKENWSFLALYDPRGRPKTAPVLPTNLTRFSTTVPNTQGQTYGVRLNTESATIMQGLEFRYFSGKRRRKLEDSLFCY